ncbi:MAG: NrsF family protein [Methylobacterium sp.]|uniref:NrsF family protein n=1 Tax=Methylobacterium sp. TaxID=409 RepID=UPI00271F4392|nr:NrsF family protein [Methylobacterium sp.]MDO9429299.1 NrsF family protein [Methylobacterium sp.]
MSDPVNPHRVADLVDDLARSLTPVRRLPGPGRRTLAWSGAVLALGALLLPLSDGAGLLGRLGVPDLRYAALGAVLTAVAAAFAAFQSSVPGRSPAWALLPLPPLVLWLGVGGLGCLRGWIAPGSSLAAPEEMRGCFVFLMSVSLPLSVLLVLMLRRACPLRPNLTAALGGLAAAAAAGALLVPFHPHDATATDLLVHLVAVLLVVGLNGLLGGRLLERTDRSEALRS